MLTEVTIFTQNLVLSIYLDMLALETLKDEKKSSHSVCLNLLEIS